MEKRIIITADDFGVVPSIDEGITAAVLAGRVNSVAIFTNHTDPVTRETSIQRAAALIAKAQAAGKSLDPGVHLTISSGKPLHEASARPENGMCDRKGNFKSFTELRNGGIPKEALRNELNEQINVMRRAGIEPKHLSCHHNTLLCFEDLFEVYVSVAKEQKLPMRSVVVLPVRRQNLYIKVFMSLKLGEDNSSWDIRQMRLLLRELSIRFQKLSNGEVWIPGYVDSSYYGPIPAFRIFGTFLDKMSRRREQRLLRILSRFSGGQDETMEFMVHLRSGKVSLWSRYRKEIDETGYKGIDHKYFDSRTVEFKSLMNSDFDKLLADKGIVKGGWNVRKVEELV